MPGLLTIFSHTKQRDRMVFSLNASEIQHRYYIKANSNIQIMPETLLCT